TRYEDWHKFSSLSHVRSIVNPNRTPLTVLYACIKRSDKKIYTLAKTPLIPIERMFERSQSIINTLDIKRDYVFNVLRRQSTTDELRPSSEELSIGILWHFVTLARFPPHTECSESPYPLVTLASKGI
ncbi:hypothetical protein RRG08_060709, partial [Elysia crispata]